MQVGITHNNQITTINPATGKVISSYNITDTEQISRIVNSARRIGFENWKRKDILERCDYIKNLAKVLKNVIDAGDERLCAITVLERISPTKVRVGLEHTAWLKEGTKLECQTSSLGENDRDGGSGEGGCIYWGK